MHGCDDLPLRELLQAQGVAVNDDPAQLAHRLGLRVTENNGIQVKVVLRGGAAEQAGFAAGDEWLAVETENGGWRLSRLDDVPLYAGRTRHVTALIARDKRLMRLRLEIPGSAEMKTWRLTVSDAAKATSWLASSDE